MSVVKNTGYYYDTWPLTKLSFTVNVVDPCLATSITLTPPSISPLIAFQSYVDKSLVSYRVTDTISESVLAKHKITEFCGQKSRTLMMNGTVSEVLAFDRTNLIELSPIETTPAGVYEGTLVVSVESVTTAVFTFKVTVIS